MKPFNLSAKELKNLEVDVIDIAMDPFPEKDYKVGLAGRRWLVVACGLYFCLFWFACVRFCCCCFLGGVYSLGIFILSSVFPSPSPRSSKLAAKGGGGSHAGKVVQDRPWPADGSQLVADDGADDVLLQGGPSVGWEGMRGG